MRDLRGLGQQDHTFAASARFDLSMKLVYMRKAMNRRVVVFFYSGATPSKIIVSAIDYLWDFQSSRHKSTHKPYTHTFIHSPNHSLFPFFLFVGFSLPHDFLSPTYPPFLSSAPALPISDRSLLLLCENRSFYATWHSHPHSLGYNSTLGRPCLCRDHNIAFDSSFHL